MRPLDGSMPAYDPGVRILRPSGGKQSGVVIGCLVLVAGGFFLVFHASRQKDILTGLLCVAFFGACGIYYVRKMILGHPELRLDSEGFSLVTFGRATRYLWTDVRDFTISGNFVIRFPWTPACVKFTVLRQSTFGDELAGYTAILPDNFGMRLDDLVALLNHYRDRALGRAGPQQWAG